MTNFKKMDKKDFVFISKPLNDKKDKAFSEFLKNREQKPGGQKPQEKQKTSNSISTSPTIRQPGVRSLKKPPVQFGLAAFTHYDYYQLT